MPTERINYEDSLRQGTDKLNKAIDQSNKAETDSQTAVNNANSAVETANNAESKANSTQSQLDTIILESGTSDAETLQARTKEDGTSFPLLKDRLNASDKQIDNGSLISKTIDKMRSGQIVKIVAYGDSITFGWEPFTGAQVSKPYPLRLQELLRSYYDNENITVLNKGTGGWTTSNGVANLTTRVLSESPDLAIVMFGINDARNAITLADYRKNLIQITNDLKAANIEVVLLSSTPILDVENNNNVKLIDYTKVVKEVATSYNVAYLNLQLEVTNLFFNKAEDAVRLLPDNLHFKADKYYIIGDIVGSKLFLHGSEILNVRDSLNVPIVKSPYVVTDLTSTATNDYPFYSSNYIMSSNGTNGTFLKFNFFIEKPGMSLSLQVPRNENGGILTPVFDGQVISGLNFYVDDSSSYENELTIIENIPVGFHELEFINTNISQGYSLQATPLVFLSNFIFKEKNVEENYLFSANSNLFLPDVEVFNKVNNGKIKFTNNNEPGGAGITFFANERAELRNKTLIIEVEGKFFNGCGFTWFGNKAENGTNTRHAKVNSGYMAYIQNTSTKLYNFKAGNSFTEIASLTTTNDLTTKKLIRVEHSISGLIKVFVDGVPAIEKTDHNADTGYFGLYAYSGGTMEIDRFEYCFK